MKIYKSQNLHESVQQKKSLVPKGGNDRVYTPQELADKIVEHYLPVLRNAVAEGKIILDPCAGNDVFRKAMRKFGITGVTSLEIENGRDFFDYHKRVGCIISNPPWSKVRQFSAHAYELADDVIWLVTVHHVACLKARFEDMVRSCSFKKKGILYEFKPLTPGFGIKEICRVPTPPKPWPGSGFQLAAVHIKRGHMSEVFTQL
jgi:hypothetical protein